jgi:hypothetical protein
MSCNESSAEPPPGGGLPKPLPSTLIDIDGWLFTPPVLQTRSGSSQTVTNRLRDILGRDPAQAELISLREELFKDILPAMTRSEKRAKQTNLETCECFRSEVLALLDRSNGIREVVEIALAKAPRKIQRKALMMHIFQVE